MFSKYLMKETSYFLSCGYDGKNEEKPKISEENYCFSKSIVDFLFVFQQHAK